ncbi:MAG: RNA methyltransferase, partial [Desulfohalobiaceae bacterium]
MQRLAVVLFRPRISENIGSVARVCANMGCSRLILVDPREWDRERAGRLATSQGREILDTIECHSTLTEALSQFSVVYGTTARTGGWRKGLLTPEEAAPRIAGDTARERDVAIVFGPEDRGLTNAEID